MNNVFNFDTIAAISTPFGESGIGIVRLSGKNSIDILKKIFTTSTSEKLKKIKSHSLHYGFIIDPFTHIEIDEVLVSVMRAPKTYTKEDIIEINCHGGWLPLKKTLELVLQNGARLATPGEFTKKAFLNGRIDITQAEAVLDIIRSKNEISLYNSIKGIKGNLRFLIYEIRDKLININALIENEISFNDTEEETNASLIKKKLHKLNTEVEAILNDSFKQSKIINGMKILILGKANVGKSSLLNFLCNDESSIISDIPGTTRDIIKEEIIINGYYFTVYDSAGIKIPENDIERLCIKKTFQYINKSDIIIYLIDADRGYEKKDHLILKNIGNENILYVINKCDLKCTLSDCYKTFINFSNCKSMKWFEISSKTGEGISNLKNELSNIQKNNEKNICEAIMLNERQYSLLKGVHGSIDLALDLLNNNFGFEFVSEKIRDGLINLDLITGSNITEDTMNAIFDNFCVGK
ncbi:MAG: tRNA uridine-5-carboxymethylaminomethyl(34) synthesis GTPase MnmE [bacterium]